MAKLDSRQLRLLGLVTNEWSTSAEIASKTSLYSSPSAAGIVLGTLATRGLVERRSFSVLGGKRQEIRWRRIQAKE